MVEISGADLPDTFTAAEAGRGGVSRRTLERMLVAGSVERVGRGLYRRTDGEPVDYDLLEVAQLRGPRYRRTHGGRRLTFRSPAC